VRHQKAPSKRGLKAGKKRPKRGDTAAYPLARVGLRLALMSSPQPLADIPPHMVSLRRI